MNIWLEFGRSVSRFMTENGRVFQSVGEGLLAGFMLIALVMAAIEMRNGADDSVIKRLIFRFIIALTFVEYYADPIPGIGYSFTEMITETGIWMATQLNDAAFNQSMRRIRLFRLSLDSIPVYQLFSQGVSAFMSTGVVWVLLVLMEAVIFSVIAFGQVAVAIGMIFGPMLVPWIIFPGMNKYFWSWLDYMIQYSQLGAVAGAYLLCMCGFFNWMFEPASLRATPTSVGNIFENVVGGPVTFIVFALAFILGAFKIPSITRGLFGGHGGESAGAHSMVPTLR